MQGTVGICANADATRRRDIIKNFIGFGVPSKLQQIHSNFPLKIRQHRDAPTASSAPEAPPAVPAGSDGGNEARAGRASRWRFRRTPAESRPSAPDRRSGIDAYPKVTA